MTETPKYLAEFPDFDDTTSADRLLAAGWADESWHNETCPNFTAGIFRCYIDFIDPERREEPDTPFRFTLEINNPDDHVMSGHVGDFDTLDELIAKRDALLPETLAKVFADSLRAQLTGAQWDDMREANVWNDDKTCASHDYLDANMVMDPAFTLTVGHQVDGDDEADCAIWNRAWRLARRDYLTAHPAPTLAPGSVAVTLTARQLEIVRDALTLAYDDDQAPIFDLPNGEQEVAEVEALFGIEPPKAA